MTSLKFSRKTKDNITNTTPTKQKHIRVVSDELYDQLVGFYDKSYSTGALTKQQKKYFYKKTCKFKLEKHGDGPFPAGTVLICKKTDCVSD